MATSTVELVPFHEYRLQSWRDEETNRLYVGMRNMCFNLGLAWGPQLTKLKKSFLFKDFVGSFLTKTPGGNQELVGLDIDRLPTWLLSINVTKVAPAVRETLKLFQQESAQVLADYWKPRVVQNEVVMEAPQKVVGTPEAWRQAANPTPRQGVPRGRLTTNMPIDTWRDRQEALDFLKDAKEELEKANACSPNMAKKFARSIAFLAMSAFEWTEAETGRELAAAD